MIMELLSKVTLITAALLSEMNQLNDKPAKARELLLKGDLDGADYRTINQKLYLRWNLESSLLKL